MLLLKLLEERDMYGYQMIEELSRRSQNVFELKTGTLYPLLHGLERQGFVQAYEREVDGSRLRRYYRITKEGHGQLEQKKREWNAYTAAIDGVMGGVQYAL